MDQAFLEREKELFKLNAKLNSKARKITATNSNKSLVKPVQVHTANNYFNYYDEPPAISKKESQDDGLELMCTKINISNQKNQKEAKRNHEITYPLFNRPTFRGTKDHNIHIHLEGLMVADGKAETNEAATTNTNSIGVESEAVDGMCFKNESILTRCSDDSSSIAPAKNETNPSITVITNNVPKSIEKKNISNEGLLKYVIFS